MIGIGIEPPTGGVQTVTTLGNADMNHDNIKLRIHEPSYDNGQEAGRRWSVLISPGSGVFDGEFEEFDVLITAKSKKKVMEFASMITNCVNENWNLRLQVSNQRGLIAQQRHSLDRVQEALLGQPLDSDYD